MTVREGAMMSHVELALGKGQDIALSFHHDGSGSGGESFDVIAVFDGHGTNLNGEDYTKNLRRAPFRELLTAPDPVAAILEYDRNVQWKYDIQTGAVGSIARIYRDRVECFTVGDSRAMVFLDGQLAYKNEEHNMQNAVEAARLAEKIQSGQIRTTKSQCPQVLNASNITMVPSSYTYFRVSNRVEVQLAPTQSFGHDGITGFVPDVAVIPYFEGQRVQVVVASDGLMDMVAADVPDDWSFLASACADEIGEFARALWSQIWNYYMYQGRLIQTGHQFPPGQRDDVGVAVWSYCPSASSFGMSSVDLA